MIGGISFSATSITSGLDADKPASPKPGNQYLATDTKILYVCYDVGVWVNATPPPSFYGDIPMVSGTAVTLFSDPAQYIKNINHANPIIQKQYTVIDISGFTEVQSCSISFVLWRDVWADITSWVIKVNGVSGQTGILATGTNWCPVTDVILTKELKPGDVIELAISETGCHESGFRNVGYKNFTIKCATPVFKPKNTGLSID